jgi:hypothetical protein
MRLKLAALTLSAVQAAIVAPYFLYSAHTALGVALAVLSFALPVLVAVMVITEGRMGDRTVRRD